MIDWVSGGSLRNSQVGICLLIFWPITSWPQRRSSRRGGCCPVRGVESWCVFCASAHARRRRSLAVGESWIGERSSSRRTRRVLDCGIAMFDIETTMWLRLRGARREARDSSP